jgi:hypothetical protein
MPLPDSWPMLAAGFGLGVLGTGFLMLNLPSFGNRQQGERKVVLSASRRSLFVASD